MMDAQELHDLIAPMHQNYYDMGGPERQIDMMLCAIVGGKIAFVEIVANGRIEWYAKAAAALAALRADAYCVVSEAWAASCPAVGDPARKLLPSQREDRCEVVVTVCVDREGNRASSVQVISRGPDGRVASLAEMSGFDNFDGKMFELF
jgi:hypothetical protein